MIRIHENIATTNHPLPLIPVEQLSADGERILVNCLREACPGTVWLGQLTVNNLSC